MIIGVEERNMPVSVKNNPFGAERPALPQKKIITGLRTPQARVLAALMPVDPSDPQSEWPLLTRARLAVRAGYTAISGTVTRALNGIHEGSSSGDAHPGLLRRGLVVEEQVDVDGISEINYRATVAGVREYLAHIEAHGGKLPVVKDASTCTNDRYKEPV
jgi:hypothetical protein